MRLALFDLDHTLLPIDSDYSWGVFSADIGWTDPIEFRQRNEQFYLQYQAGTLDVHEYVRFATAAVRRHSVREAEQAHQRFMRDVIQPAIRPVALELVRRHQRSGDLTVIVTATNEFVTRPIATAFGVDELIAVELERDATGALTGDIHGTPSFREGKVTRVEQWLQQRGLGWTQFERSSFYSDSVNDLALLEKVSEPVATNPDTRLRQIALERGWRILDLWTEGDPGLTGTIEEQ